jgi:plastocyanin
VKPTELTIIILVNLIAGGFIVGGFSLTISYLPQASAQMMGPGMGMMQHGMMMNRPGMMMGPLMMFPNVIITNATCARSLAGIIVTIVRDAQDMGDKAFQPNPIHIKVTNTVTWVNGDRAIHTVTSGFDPNDPGHGSQFDSGLLAEGQTFTHTFKTAGVVINCYRIYCNEDLVFNLMLQPSKYYLNG